MLRSAIARVQSRPWIVVVALFTGLALVMTYPLVLVLGKAMAGPPGDNFEYLYEVWWLKQALFERHTSPFFNRDLFYPFGYQVITARHHSLLSTVLSLPLSLLSNTVVAYNTVSLLSFVLSAVGMYLLVFYLTRSRAAGVISGIIFAFCPYRLFRLHVGHLPLLQTQWFPFLFLYIERTIQNPRPSQACMSGLFYALIVFSSPYYAYMVLIPLLVYVLVRARPWRRYWLGRDFWACILIFVGMALATAGPLVYSLAKMYAKGHAVLSPVQGTWISASPVDFFVPSFLQPLWGKYLLSYYIRCSHENIVSLGVIPLLLTAVALWRSRSRPAVVYSVVFATSFILALGPFLRWGRGPLYLPVPSWLERGFTVVMTLLGKRLALNPTNFYWKLWVKDSIYVPLPTLLLYLFLPFFTPMSYPSRFAIFATLAVSVLAGIGASRLLLHRNPGKPGTGWCLAVLVAGLILFEFAAVPPPFGMSVVRAQPVDQWLAAQQDDSTVMLYPLDKAITGPALYATAIHGKRVAYGYGGLYPRAFVEKMPVLSHFPAEECIALLKQWGVRYILVCSTSYGESWPQLERSIAASPQLRYVTKIQQEPVSRGDRLLRQIPEYSAWFVVDQVFIYEIVP